MTKPTRTVADRLCEQEARRRPPPDDGDPANDPPEYRNSQAQPYPEGDAYEGPPPAAASPPTAPRPVPSDGLAIILQDFQDRYRPRFRRGRLIYSEAEGAEVRPADACFAPDRALLEKLRAAADAPRDKDGVVVSRLVHFFWTWSKPAWQEMLKDLPREEALAEVIPAAEEQFRQRVSAALQQFVVLGETSYVRGQEQTQTRRTTLIKAAQQFADHPPAPGWQSVRSYLLWTRKDGDALRVALRHGLFAQLVGFKDLEQMGKQKFAELARLYGVGAAGKDLRIKRGRAVELAPEFIAELLEGPGELLEGPGDE